MSRLRQTAVLLPGLAIALLVPAGRVVAEEVRGVVSGVDLSKHELRVDGRGPARGETVTFTLDDKTLVLFGSQKGSAMDLNPGRRIRVEYEVAGDGTHIARVVRAAGRPLAARATPAGRITPAAPPVATGPNAAATGDAVTGVLQRVARADREIVVIGPGAKGPETETTVAVPEGAKVVKEGKPSSLENLKEGDAVAVRVERRDGKLTAVEVQAGPGAALSAATPAPDRSQMIPRIRQALHMADEVLRHLDSQKP
jgi:hypothetical protein